MGIKIMLTDNGPSDPLRLAFPSLFVKRPGMTNNDGTKGKDKFEATLIFSPTGKNADAVKRATAEACQEAWGDNWEALYSELGGDQKALRKGVTKVGKDGSVYDGFEGNSFVTARNENRPGVYDRDQSVLVADDGRPYGGCYVNAEIEIWAQKPKPGVARRVNVSLLGVQFVREGDAFGSGAAPSKPSSFPSLSVEEDEGEKPASRFSALDD